MNTVNWLSVAFLVLLAAGCGGRHESLDSPSPLPPVNFVPTRETTRVTVAGWVGDGDGNPVVGATVTPWAAYTPFDTGISDESGAFSLTLSVTAQDRAFSVTVEKAGYETGELSRSLDVAGQTLLRIHPIQHIGAGDSARLAIDTDDTACGYHWGYLCRRVRVVSDRAGTLALQVVADADVAIGMLEGPEGFPQQLERRRTLEVSAGSVTVAEVAAESLTSAVLFELKTTFEPR